MLGSLKFCFSQVRRMQRNVLTLRQCYQQAGSIQLCEVAESHRMVTILAGRVSTVAHGGVKNLAVRRD
jgi:hypothetical protein